MDCRAPGDKPFMPQPPSSQTFRSHIQSAVRDEGFGSENRVSCASESGLSSGAGAGGMRRQPSSVVHPGGSLDGLKESLHQKPLAIFEHDTACDYPALGGTNTDLAIEDFDSEPGSYDSCSDSEAEDGVHKSHAGSDIIRHKLMPSNPAEVLLFLSKKWVLPDSEGGHSISAVPSVVPHLSDHTGQGSSRPGEQECLLTSRLTASDHGIPDESSLACSGNNATDHTNAGKSTTTVAAGWSRYSYLPLKSLLGQFRSGGAHLNAKTDKTPSLEDQEFHPWWHNTWVSTLLLPIFLLEPFWLSKANRIPCFTGVDPRTSKTTKRESSSRNPNVYPSIHHRFQDIKPSIDSAINVANRGGGDERLSVWYAIRDSQLDLIDAVQDEVHHVHSVVSKLYAMAGSRMFHIDEVLAAEDATTALVPNTVGGFAPRFSRGFFGRWGLRLFRYTGWRTRLGECHAAVLLDANYVHLANAKDILGRPKALVKMLHLVRYLRIAAADDGDGLWLWPPPAAEATTTTTATTTPPCPDSFDPKYLPMLARMLLADLAKTKEALETASALAEAAQKHASTQVAWPNMALSMAKSDDPHERTMFQLEYFRVKEHEYRVAMEESMRALKPVADSFGVEIDVDACVTGYGFKPGTSKDLGIAERDWVDWYWTLQNPPHWKYVRRDKIPRKAARLV